MKRITLELEQNYQRPVLKLGQLENFRVLIDTGARFPVWTAGRRTIERLGGINQNKRIRFSGFGGNTEGDLYRLTLDLGGLQFPDMPIVLEDNSRVSVFQLILSAANFDGMLYQIDTINHKFNIDIPDDCMVRRLVIRREPEDNSLYIEIERE